MSQGFAFDMIELDLKLNILHTVCYYLCQIVKNVGSHFTWSFLSVGMSSSVQPSHRFNLPAGNCSSNPLITDISSSVKVKVDIPLKLFSKIACRSNFDPAPDRGTHKNPH